MINGKSVLVSVALLVAPLNLYADNSFKDTYQFGTGSHERLTQDALNVSDTYRDEHISAFDNPAGPRTSGERTEMAVLEGKPAASGPSVRGFIGSY